MDGLKKRAIGEGLGGLEELGEMRRVNVKLSSSNGMCVAGRGECESIPRRGSGRLIQAIDEERFDEEA
jgi:hypothetical protein